MYTLIRSCRLRGFQPQMILPSKNYSAVHNRSHFSLKYRIDPYVVHANWQWGRPFLFNNQYQLPGDYVDSIASYNGNGNGSVRYFRTGQRLYEQPSSKVEATVQTIKNKQKEKVEEIMKEASCTKSGDVDSATSKPKTSSGQMEETAKPKTVAVKKNWKQKVKDELIHYYHGFRLLFIDIKVCSMLLWRVLNGKTLTRRENNLLMKTTGDLFRLIPFSVFIIVPFMEFTLPFFIKFFPNMLPSTFQTAKEREDKLRQSLNVRLEMAKFLQKTLDEMAVQHSKGHSSEEAKQFDLFFQRIKNPSEHVTNDEIIKFAKRFDDEYILDALSRQQLAALCRVLDMNTVGTSNLLRFLLRMKLRSLLADDRVIVREGVDSLDLWELQNACKARGMRAYGLTQEKMRTQLKEWINLSVNEKVPPTLLLLTRTIFITDDSITTDKLKTTLSSLPDALATQTKACIGEREGKIDNKTRIEIIKDEERKINEEREEERAIAKAICDKAAVCDPSKEPDMVDKAPSIGDDKPCPVRPSSKPVFTAEEVSKKKEVEILDALAKDEEEKTLTSKDVELLCDALKSLSTDKKMVVEKETIKDIKEELEDYQEDVEELCEVRNVVKEPIEESRAAKLLFKKVNTMINQLDQIVVEMAEKHKRKAAENASSEEIKKAEELAKYQQQDTVQIDELIQTIKRLKNTSDDTRLKQIQNVLSKLDADKDGCISVEEVLKVVECIGRENVKLNEKQLEELICLLDKEQVIEAEEKIEKALARSIKEVEEAKKIAEEIKNQEAAKCGCDELKDRAKEIKD